MQILKHYIVQNVEKLLGDLNLQKEALLGNEYGVDQQCILIVEEGASFLNKIGEASLESKLKNFAVILHTCMSGVHPFSMELLKTNKRQFVKAFTQEALVKTCTILEDFLDKQNTKLVEATEQLNQVLLSIYQSNPSIIESLNNLDAIENFWEGLCQSNPQVMLLNKKILLEITKNDIHILLDKSISKIKTP